MADYPVADLKLPDKVHFLRRDWFNSNSVLITGTPTVLIDCGAEGNSSWLLDRIRACGVAPEEIDLIIATHSHTDHVGAIAELQRRFGLPVAMHEYEAYYVNRDDQWATWRTPHGTLYPQFRVDNILRDGDVLSLEGFSLRIVHTPGHAYGGISLYCPEHRFVVCGDAVWEKAIGVINVRLEGSIAPFLARDSVRKLMALDTDVALPGHGRAILNAAENFRAALAYVEGLLDDPKRMAYDLVWRVLYYYLCAEGEFTFDVLADNVSRLSFFGETNQLFFQQDDRTLLKRVLDDLEGRGLVQVEAGVVRAVRQR